MTNLRPHIDALIEASLKTEERLRAAHSYAVDCASGDAASVFDAVARKIGKRGFVIALHDDGRGASISTIGDMSAELDEGNAPPQELAYEQAHEESETMARARKPKTKKEQPPMSGLDAARRTARLSAEAKRHAADQYQRNADYAATLKAKSRALFEGKTPHAIRAR